MPRSVDYYFDVGSPAAHLAWTQLPALCQSLGAQLRCAPLLLGGVFGAPTMYVGDEMFFGQDRLEFVRDALAAGG